MTIENDNFTALFRELISISHSLPKACVMADLEWKRLESGTGEVSSMTDGARKRTVTAVCGGESLTATLFPVERLRRRETESFDGVTDIRAEEPEDIVFDAEAIRAFVVTVGDLNPIHGGERPIVPGCQLLRTVRGMLADSDISRVYMRFERPVFAGEPVRFEAASDGTGVLYANGVKKASVSYAKI